MNIISHDADYLLACLQSFYFNNLYPSSFEAGKKEIVLLK